MKRTKQTWSSEAERVMPSLPDGWHGIPQLVSTSDESLPTVLGLRELGAKQCMICATPEKPADRLAAVLHGFGIEIISCKSSPDYLLSPLNVQHNVEVAGKICELLKSRGIGQILWNYTPGTKQMFLGLYQGMRANLPESMVKGMFYIDTSQAHPLWIVGESSPRLLNTSLTASELLAANGWKLITAVRIDRPLAHLPRLYQENIREWLGESLRKQEVCIVGERSQMSCGPGDGFSYHVADAVIRAGRVESVYVNAKVAPLNWHNSGDGREQDIDFMVAVDNTLVMGECKHTASPEADVVLKVAQITRAVGGRKAIPIFFWYDRSGERNVAQSGAGRKGESHEVGVVYWSDIHVDESLSRLDDVVCGRLAITRPASRQESSDNQGSKEARIQ